MRDFPIARSIVALVFLLATGACGATPTEPDPITYEQKTETYTGTVATGQTTAFHFAVTNPGSITASITQMSPINTLTMGLDLGLWDATAELCAVQLTNSAVLNTVITGNPTAAGEFCVAIVDIGNVQSPIEFTIKVTHY